MGNINSNGKKLTKLMIWGAFLVTSACKSSEYLLIEPVKGKIVSSLDKTPVGYAKIYTDKNAFNAFDTISTKKDGSFFIDKVTVNDHKDQHLQRDISYLFSIEKKGYKKIVIDVRNFRKHKTPSVKDTIDLGVIYMDLSGTPLKNHVNGNANIDWTGHYTCNFLRLKEESADPRAWGMIYLDIDGKVAHFHLDTYNEDIKKELRIKYKHTNEVELFAVGNESLKLSIVRDGDKYLMHGNLIDQIIEEKEVYELKKNVIK